MGFKLIKPATTLEVSRLSIVAVATLACLPCTLEGRSFVYEVVPLTLTNTYGETYKLSGTLTSNCNDCTLSGFRPSSLVDFDVSVDGPSGAQFAQGWLASAASVAVTPTEILLSLRYSFPSVGYPPEIFLSWNITSAGAEAVYAAPFFGLAPATFGDPSVTSFVIATLIPEPSGPWLATFSGLFWVLAITRRSMALCSAVKSPVVCSKRPQKRQPG